MADRKRNVFILGMDDHNRDMLEGLINADEINFHELLGYEESHGAAEYHPGRLIDRAEKRLDTFEGPVDAIIGFWDFPISLLQPILSHRRGLRAPPLESVFKCEHKYWSRLQQSQVIPECTPRFQRFDPFDDDALSKIELDFPFWIKPIKSFAGHLGFRIRNKQDFEKSIPIIRKKIHRFKIPFYELTEYADLPAEIADPEAGFYVAEQIIDGRQCTVEGYVCNGRIDVHGIVDSHRYPNMSSFSRYQYPSNLSEPLRDRMKEKSARIIKHIGFDNGTYNIEFFYDEDRDDLWLLEINPRISQSHSDLFAKVDGVSNHQVLVDTALDDRPRFPHREGKYGCAGKFFIRSFEEDGFVRRVPTPDQIEHVKQTLPDTLIYPQVDEGMRLSDKPYEDSYSYKLAILYLGAENEDKLLQKFDRAAEMLPFEIEPTEAPR